MPNPYGYKHDDSHDAKIKGMLDNADYGSWKTSGKVRTFRPTMSFFHHVTPHHLASYFVEHGGDDLRLDLP